MSTPNPLIPQGTFLSQASKGASNVRIAVATIIAIHMVFFGGLLLQGCKRDANVTAALDTNAAASNLTLPPIDSGSLFYTNANSLPPESSNAPSSVYTAAQPSPTDALAPSTVNTARDAWRSNNLGVTGNFTPLEQGSTATRDYTVVRGDTLGKIAAANGVTLSALREANPGLEPTRLRVGMKIQIPAAAPGSTLQPTSTRHDTAAAGSNGGPLYTVKSGDTLTKVAKMHGVTVSQVRAANNLRTSGLRVGQKLKIPASTNATARNGTRSTNSL